MTFKKVIKRSGEQASFDVKKIENAVAKAFMATAEIETRDVSTMSRAIALIVETSLRESGFTVPTVEQIQDAVELALMRCGYQSTAKAYILYRSEHQKVRDSKNTLLDYKELVNSYINSVEDWKKSEASAAPLSVGGLILSNSAAITANYWLSEVYGKEVSSAHKEGELHIHDLSMLTAYSSNWSLRKLILEGIPSAAGGVSSSRARHLSTIMGQMVNFLGIMQNEWASKQSFASFDTFLAPFVKEEKLDKKQVKQHIQSFVYSINMPSRWGTRPPVTAVYFDGSVPDELAEQRAYGCGRELEFTYADCKEEMAVIKAAFIDVMREGDSEGRAFKYPLSNLRELADIYDDAADIISEFRSPHGSIGIVSINMPRLAYLSSDKEEFYSRLEKLLDIAVSSLNAKRKSLEVFLSEGLYPYTLNYISGFGNYASTIGICGLTEAVRNADFIYGGISSQRGKEFAAELVDFLNKKTEAYSERFEGLYRFDFNTPMSANRRFALRDIEEFPELELPQKKDEGYAYTGGGLNVSASAAVVLEGASEYDGEEYDDKDIEYGTANEIMKDTLADRILKSGGMIGNLYNVTRFKKNDGTYEAAEVMDKRKSETVPSIGGRRTPVFNFASFDDFDQDGDQLSFGMTEDLTYSAEDDKI